MPVEMSWGLPLFGPRVSSETILVAGPSGTPFSRRICPRDTPCRSHVLPPPLPALLPPVLSPSALGTKSGAPVGGQQRPPVRRRSRVRGTSGPSRPAGAPPPCRWVASWPSARLNNAFWPIHRRGLGAPGPDQGCPLWLPGPRWTRWPGAIHPLRCLGFGEGSPAVTNPRGTLALARVHVAERSSLLGLVTAHARAPRQRSQPSREASLGRRLSSTRPGGRPVGCPVARPLVWGRGGRVRSRRSWRVTGTAPAAGSLGRTGPPASLWEARLRRGEQGRAATARTVAPGSWTPPLTGGPHLLAMHAICVQTPNIFLPNSQGFL